MAQSESGSFPPGPNIGETAAPPFAVRPDPAVLFGRRGERFAALAEGHPLGPYLSFLAALSRAQQAAEAGLEAVRLPDPERLAQAREYGMPPIQAGRFEPDEISDAVFAAVLEGLAGAEVPVEAAAALAGLREASGEQRRQMMQAVLLDLVPDDQVAAHVVAAAALQVQFARMAALLEADKLAPVADAACPACGSAPVASLVVGWPGAHGSRFCCCSLCATHWHVVRVRCLICGSDGKVSYYAVEGGPEEVKAEACEDCGSYVKIFHQHKAPGIEPAADDVASLGLDLLMRDKGSLRSATNPFLLGY